MSNRKHLKMICRCRDDHDQINVWNRWREKHPDILPDLAGADLANIILSTWREWESGNLFIANLAKVNLKTANLRQSDLTECNLEGAILTDADLFAADLKEARFQGADPCRADLSCILAVNTIL